MKIEKLEIKYLSGYLPYGLMAKILDYKSDYVGKEFDTIRGVDQWDRSGKLWCALTLGGSKPSLERITPILRPLRLLTEEITHEGNKIVPIVEIANIAGIKLSKYGFHSNDNDFEVHTSYECFGYGNIENSFYRVSYDETNHVNNQIQLFQLMYELKFDIYSLIDSGLAIDSTTVGNPYDK